MQRVPILFFCISYAQQVAIIPITKRSTFGLHTHQITWERPLLDPYHIRTNATSLTIPSTGIWHIHFTMTLTFANPSFFQYFINGRLVATRGTDPTGYGLAYISESLFLQLLENDVFSLTIACGPINPCGNMDSTRLAGSNHVVFIKI